MKNNLNDSTVEKNKKQSWFKYVPLTDKSILKGDKILWIIYVFSTLILPLSAIISLFFIHLIRKNKTHSTYKKAATFGVILIAILSLISGIGSKFPIDNLPDDEYVVMVKNGKLKGYPNKTIGKAINSFFSKPKWKHIVDNKGKHYVNATGGITYANKPVNAMLQFKVNKEKGTFTINAFEMNGVPQNKLIYLSLIEKIFE